MYHHHHQHHSHHHQPTQLSYLPGTGLQYAYNNYCMMPPVYNSINSLVAAPTHPATSLLPTNSSGPAVMTEDARESRESVLVSSSSGGLSLPDSNLSVVEVEAGEDRTDYMEELSRERESLEQGETNHARRLIDRGELSELSRPQFSHPLITEISLLQSGQAQAPTNCEVQMVDVYREKPIRLVVKVTVPVKEHPKFNFVGKLLGPKGNSLKRLQEETLTKMAVLGKGSMRDKAKEEEMRLSKDPKYHHLNDDLHVEIVAFAPPAEAHARMSYALTEVRKYLIPDSNDTIRQLQMKELEILNSSEKMLGDPSMQLLKTVTNPLQSIQPLLVPSTSYLSSPHLSLLPTPPLDTASPTIAAPPTKYDTEQVVVEAGEASARQLKMTDSKRLERRREAQPY